MSTSASPTRLVLRGLAASLTIAAGYVPVAISFGLAAVQAGLPPALVVWMSLVVYAGAAQFLLIGLLTAGGGFWAVVPTVWLMNARHLLYGPALRRHLPARTLPPTALASGLTDEVFATATAGITRVPEAERAHWLLGLQIGAYLAWLAGTVFGAVAGSAWLLQVPLLRDALAFVLPALFVALVAGAASRAALRPMAVAAAVTAALLALASAAVALPVGILAGALAAIVGRRHG